MHTGHYMRIIAHLTSPLLEARRNKHFRRPQRCQTTSRRTVDLHGSTDRLVVRVRGPDWVEILHMESLYSSSHGNVQRGDRAWERAIAVSRELGPSRHQAAGLFGFSLVSTSGFDRCRTYPRATCLKILTMDQQLNASEAPLK